MSKRVHSETTVPISQPDAKKLRRTVAKRLDALFEKLIDKQGGPAATVEGEILRAVNTVINCSNAGKQHFSRSGDYGCTFANTFRKTLPASAVCYLATSPSVPNEVRDEFKGWAERNKYGPYMKYSKELGFHDELAVLQQITLTFIEGKDEEYYEENEDDFEKYHHEAIRLGFFHDLEERFDALKRKLLVRDGEFSDEFSDGPADTVEGEMLRAVDHIIRTFKEDGGHHFAKGYGAEEAGPCMEYLTESDSIPGKVRDLFVRWAECYQCKYEYEYDDTGQKAFEELMKIAVEYIEGVGSKFRDNKEDCENKMDGGDKQFKLKYGSRAKVWNGTAEMTTGRLKKDDLKKNKYGQIVSKKASANGKKAVKVLNEKGYTTKKGVFGVFKDGKNLAK